MQLHSVRQLFLWEVVVLHVIKYIIIAYRVYVIMSTYTTCFMSKFVIIFTAESYSVIHGVFAVSTQTLYEESCFLTIS